ncbi:MAG TPA: DedA family protein [Myxococcales bacterium]|nr:DedA family protein [Myxococcales bacterium]
MIARFLESLFSWISGVISAMGYPGVALLMAIESCCIPLPSEMIMPFAGWLVATGRFSLWGIALAGAAGCVIGSIPAYYAGQYGGRAFIHKYGRYVLMSAEHLDLAERFFQRRGEITVLIARLLPVVRTFIAFPAGVARMPMGKFILYTFVGSFPWCLGLGWVGMKVGEHRELLTPWFHRADAVIVALVLLGVAWFVWKQTKSRRQTTRVPGEP